MSIKRFLVAMALCAVFAQPALAVTNITVSITSILVDTNGVIVYPTNLFQVNQIALNSVVATNIEQMILDIAQATADVEIPAALEDYYLKSQSDIRYLLRDSYVYGDQVLATGTWARLSGNTLQQVLSSIDSQIGQGGGTGAVTIISNVYNTTTGTTNASAVGVSFAPQSYTPSAATVQEHLRAIDSRLQYLANYISTSGVPVVTQTLVSVAVSGANTAAEGVDEVYTLTATLSDASTTNVTTSAGAQWTVTGSAAASMLTNRLHVGAIYSNVTVAVRGTYSLGGVTKDNSKNVLVIDTNPPTLLSVYVTGTNTVDERATAAYRAWAVIGPATNDVTDQATWSVIGAGASIINGTLTAAEVTSNTAVGVVAQYAYGSTIKSDTNAVTIRSIDQRLVITVNYSGAYNVGTLHLDCWDNRQIQNFTRQSWTIPSFAAAGTHTITNQLSTQYTGDTYWYAWLDTDGNNILNGLMNTPLTSEWGPTALRIDEPAGIASTMPVPLTIGNDQALSFTLTDYAPGCHVRQGWVPADIGSSARSVFNVYNASMGGTYAMTSHIMTNRTYWCEWDAMAGNYMIGTTNGLFASGTIGPQGPSFWFYIWKANVDGTIDYNVGKKGWNSTWP